MNFVPHVPSVDTGSVAVEVDELEVLVDEDDLTVDVEVFVDEDDVVLLDVDFEEAVEDLELVAEDDFEVEEDFAVTDTNEFVIDVKETMTELVTGLVVDDKREDELVTVVGKELDELRLCEDCAKMLVEIRVLVELRVVVELRLLVKLGLLVKLNKLIEL